MLHSRRHSQHVQRGWVGDLRGEDMHQRDMGYANSGGREDDEHTKREEGNGLHSVNMSFQLILLCVNGDLNRREDMGERGVK